MTNHSNWPGSGPAGGASPQYGAPQYNAPQYGAPQQPSGAPGASPGGQPQQWNSPQLGGQGQSGAAPGGQPQQWNSPQQGGQGQSAGSGGENPVPGSAMAAPKNRKPLIITAIVTVAVLVVAGGFVGVLLSMRGDKNGDPNNEAADVARAYLEALADGDAEAALKLSATQPASTELLTDEILKKQREKMPITDIEVKGAAAAEPNSDKRTTMVQVAAKFGGQRVEAKLPMIVADGEWKMGASFVEGSTDIMGSRISMPNLSGSDSDSDASATEPADFLTVFGKPMPKSRHFYVFPGYLEVGMSVPGVAVNEVPPTTLDDVSPYTEYYLDAKYSLSEAGKKIAGDTILAWVKKCFSPGKLTGSCADIVKSWEPQYDTTSMQLNGPVDLSGLSYEMKFGSMEVRVSGGIKGIPITMNINGKPDSVTVDLNRVPDVDLSKDPAVIVEPGN